MCYPRNKLVLLVTVIEIAVGEYDVDMGKLMLAAEKKCYEEHDTYYLNIFNRDNYIRADSGMSAKHERNKFKRIKLITIYSNWFLKMKDLRMEMLLYTNLAP